jgi:hypothetical protein
MLAARKQESSTEVQHTQTDAFLQYHFGTERVPPSIPPRNWFYWGLFPKKSSYHVAFQGSPWWRGCVYSCMKGRAPFSALWREVRLMTRYFVLCSRGDTAHLLDNYRKWVLNLGSVGQAETVAVQKQSTRPAEIRRNFGPGALGEKNWIKLIHPPLNTCNDLRLDGLSCLVLHTEAG